MVLSSPVLMFSVLNSLVRINVFCVKLTSSYLGGVC
jgi:hypothetical protein